MKLKEKRRKLISEAEQGEDIIEEYNIRYPVFTNIPEDLELTSKHIGKKVWLAGRSRTTTAYLRRIHEEGENQYPDGGYEILIKGNKYLRDFFLDQAVLHPDELTKSQEQIEYEKAVKKAKKKKYKNPFTGRMCSYKYSLREGFITETGEKVPKGKVKMENPETGRMCSYRYLRNKGIVDKKGKIIEE